MELQFLILHHLGGLLSYYYHSHSWLSTLATCCLVCRTWFPVAQRYLLERVTLRSDKHLKQLVSRKSTSSDPIGLVKELEILSGVKYHQRPFHHLVPLYTTNRLLCLKRLAFWGSKGDGRKDVFPVSTQFRMHLSCLRHVTCMELANFHFQSFWDLRRFVVALPALSSLSMRVVSWPQFSDGLGRVPSLPFSARTLRKIDCVMSSGSPDVPWFWVTTHKLPSLEHQMVAEYHIEDRYPAVTVKDAAIIGRYIHKLGSGLFLNFEWTYSREYRCCRLLLYSHNVSLD